MNEHKVVVIHQPDFLPYLGFFHRFLKANLWVIFDHVQFLRNSKSWHHRDKIKTPQGAKWLTLSVKKGPRETPINEVILSREVDWQTNHLNLIKQNYKEADGFKEVFPYLEELYTFKCERMVDFNLKSIGILLKLFALEIQTVLASTLSPEGSSNELLVDVVKKSDSDTYLSGTGARDYFDPKPFAEAGIKVLWQEFNHPVYPQLHGEFMPFLSAIDLLLNCGVEKSREILRRC